MIQLENQPLAVVTGAGRGIGAAIARRLALAGARVLVADVRHDLAADCAKGIQEGGGIAWSAALDVTAPEACAELAETVRRDHGSLSILVNNAGVSGELPIDDPGVLALWDRTMAVNLDGVFHVTRAFHPDLRATQGSIVNLASMASFHAVTRSFSYMASKGGVKMLTQVLAKELASDGIRVNAVAPGLIDTPLLDQRKQDVAWMDGFRSRTPLRRLGGPDEVADAVLFLASPMATYITGVILPVDGGFLAC